MWIYRYLNGRDVCGNSQEQIVKQPLTLCKWFEEKCFVCEALPSNILYCSIGHHFFIPNKGVCHEPWYPQNEKSGLWCHWRSWPLRQAHNLYNVMMSECWCHAFPQIALGVPIIYYFVKQAVKPLVLEGVIKQLLSLC